MHSDSFVASRFVKHLKEHQSLSSSEVGQLLVLLYRSVSDGLYHAHHALAVSNPRFLMLYVLLRSIATNVQEAVHFITGCTHARLFFIRCFSFVYYVRTCVVLLLHEELMSLQFMCARAVAFRGAGQLSVFRLSLSSSYYVNLHAQRVGETCSLYMHATGCGSG